MITTLKKIQASSLLVLLLVMALFTSCTSDDNNSNFNSQVSLDLSKVPLDVPTESGMIWKETLSENAPLVTAPFSFSHKVTVSQYGTYWNGFTVSNSTDKKDHKENFYLKMYGTMADTSIQSPFLVANTEGVSEKHTKGASIDVDNALTVVTLDDNFIPIEVELGLSPYTYYSTKNGDQFAKKFEKGDFFKVIVFGLDANKVIINSPVESFLIDYRKAVSEINTDWQKVKLKSLGKVKYLVFYIDSSDKGISGVNTPAFFTVKNLVISK